MSKKTPWTGEMIGLEWQIQYMMRLPQSLTSGLNNSKHDEAATIADERALDPEHFGVSRSPNTRTTIPWVKDARSRPARMEVRLSPTLEHRSTGIMDKSNRISGPI